MNHVPANTGPTVPSMGAAPGSDQRVEPPSTRPTDSQTSPEPLVKAAGALIQAESWSQAVRQRGPHRMLQNSPGAVKESALRLRGVPAERIEEGLLWPGECQATDAPPGAGTDPEFYTDGFDSTAPPPPPRSHQQASSSPDADEELPVCFLPPQRRWPAPWQTMAIAGTSIAATAAGVFYGPAGQPLYEGRVLLSAQAGVSSDWAAADGDGASEAAAAPEQPFGSTNNMAPPEAIAPAESVTNSLVLFTQSETLKPILEDLKQQDIHLTERALTQRLAVKPLDAHTLEMSYRDNDPETVRQVLSRVAQVYVDHQPSCVESPCQSFHYIQRQMAQTQAVLVRLIAEQEQMQQRYGTQSPLEQWRSLELSLHHLERKQEEVSAQVDALLPALQRTQQQMAIAPTPSSRPLAELSPNQAIAPALDMLMESSRYQTLLNQWQQLDYEIAAAVLAPQPDAATAAGLTQHHQELLKQLQQEVYQTADAVLLDSLPDDLQTAIQADPLQLDYVESWLSQSHRIHLLQTRQQNLIRLTEQLNQQLTQWRAIAQREQRLKQQIAVANQNLDHYQEHYARLKPQVVQQTQVWQMVAPPEVMQAERPLTTLVSQLTHAAAEAASPQNLF